MSPDPRERYLIRAIISLPGDTFRRAGSRVKTSVLVLERKTQDDEAQPSCFAFFSESLGVDDLTPKASGADIQEARTRAETEPAAVIQGYADYLAGKKGSLVLGPERLRDRLDLKYCVPEFGRMAKKWRASGAEVKPLNQCVRLVEDTVVPSEQPETIFTLVKVSYEGKCEMVGTKRGRAIRADKMYRVSSGQMIFSQTRATDGAIGIVPPEMNGALVSGSYYVFDCGDDEETVYLWAVLRSHELRADMQSQSPGSGRYVTYWPEIGDLLVPLLPREKRRSIGRVLLDAWQKERELDIERNKAFGEIAVLGVESAESIRRFNASKAPT